MSRNQVLIISKPDTEYESTTTEYELWLACSISNNLCQINWVKRADVRRCPGTNKNFIGHVCEFIFIFCGSLRDKRISYRGEAAYSEDRGKADATE